MPHGISMDAQALVAKQRTYFESGKTLPVEYRLAMLKKLRDAVAQNEERIAAALKQDLNKAHFEAYMTEIGMVLDDLRYAISHVASWARRKTVRTPLAQFSARSFILPEPYGVALIMSPWNYPFQLCIEPLTGAIAAGNCAIVKPSAYAANTSRLIAELLGSLFPPEYVAVVEGGREENTALLQQKFDYIFFTGSVNVGKYVMECASRNLTPMSLELGGKSPVIVDKSADLPLAAKRIAFGKYINAGQTCVAPDYVLAEAGIRDALIEEIKKAVAAFYPNGDYASFPTIVNDKHFARVMGLIQEEKLVFGGKGDASRRFIAPTLMQDVTWDDPVMQEEIFGPILPILTYTELDEAIGRIVARPKPLALYLFTTDKAVEEKVFSRVSFGGGCVNDTIIHLATPYMGFGGVGESGMGSYHGKRSFDTFTHYKSIVKKHNFIDLPMRYQPYTDAHFKLVRMFLK
ncbi:MAG: aldehyde dehydrogenase [Clostridia bacterium]|nr:aldehyde dehydrogenase [Clostridia bacterium]